MMIMLKDSLIQCRPVKDSFLRNVNFEFVMCTNENFNVELCLCHYCMNPHLDETLVVVHRS